jgi:F0F1-type ATP synthase membrane subunit b/b'
MKFLIFLALAVAATQAAFTGSLVQQVQPLIQGLKIQSLSRSSVEASFQTQLGEAINQQVTNILNQVQQAVDNAQNVAQTLHESVSNAIQQGVAIGQQAVQQAQNLLASLLSNILGAFSGSNKNALPAYLVQFIQNLASNQQVLDAIHSTQLYNCLIGKGVQVEYQHLADLYYSNGLLDAFQAARPQIRECIEEQGLSSIHDVVAPYVPTIVGLLQQLGVQDLVHNAIVAVIGQEAYDEYVLPLLNNKGLIGNVISGVSQAAQNLGSFVVSVAQNAIQSLQAKIEEIKQQALAFVQSGLQTAQQLTFQAAQNLITFLQPYKEDLGLLYNQVLDQLSAIHAGLVLPF